MINGSGISKSQNVTKRKPDNVDLDWSRMTNMTVFKQHFNLLGEKIGRLTINKLNVRNKRSSISNCYESMIAMDKRTGRVVIPRKTKQDYAETTEMRDHITENACAHLQVGQFWRVIFSFSRSFSQIHIIR